MRIATPLPKQLHNTTRLETNYKNKIKIKKTYALLTVQGPLRGKEGPFHINFFLFKIRPANEEKKKIKRKYLNIHLFASMRLR